METGGLTGTGRVEILRLASNPSRKPVKFLFFAAKILLNTKQNVHTDMCFLNSL